MPRHRQGQRQPAHHRAPVPHIASQVPDREPAPPFGRRYCRRPSDDAAIPARSGSARGRHGVSADIRALTPSRRTLQWRRLRESRCSACDHHFLIKPAEERFLADTNAVAGKPFGDFVAPQIERKGFKFGQQRSPNVAQRMPPPRQIIIDNDDPSTWLYDATKLAERSLAIMAGLLMQ